MATRKNLRIPDELPAGLETSLAPEMFWRVHRAGLVNINRIREAIPWFKSSFQLGMDDKKGTEIPVSRAQTKRLRLRLPPLARHSIVPLQHVHQLAVR